MNTPYYIIIQVLLVINEFYTFTSACKSIYRHAEGQVQIGRIPDDIYEIIKGLQSDKISLPTSNENRLSVTQATKIKFDAVLENINLFISKTDTLKIQKDLQAVSKEIQSLESDGKVRRYVLYDSSSTLSRHFEIFCIAIRKYEITKQGTNIELYDIIFATFDHEKGIDYILACTGIVALAACGTLVASLYGRISLTWKRVILSMITIILSIIGNTILNSSNKGKDQLDINNRKVLEAFFLSELIKHGYVYLDENNRQLNFKTE